jgi:secreted PhoX family phosphatase
MIHDDGISNNSGNTPFEEILGKVQNRRKILSGGIGAAASFLAGHSMGVLAQGRPSERPVPSLVNFTPVPVAGGGGTAVRISEDYDYSVIIPWGTDLLNGTGDKVGIGHDGMWYYPLGRISDKSSHGLLVVNHEYGDNIIVLGKNTPESLSEVRTSQEAHGLSVVELVRQGGRFGEWMVTPISGYNRRIHVNSPVEFSGPVAGSDLLKNAANNPYLGTVNNCANGYTPWGTYLTCEENFNGYFGATGAWTPTAMQSRYGFAKDGFGYGWHLFDPRFDLSNPAYANEGNRFGWIVEIDPYDPASKPVKRTALGRVKHEGIAMRVGRGGRVVGYMGDDERFDYIYKFVSEDNWASMRAKGKSPLDHGQLYVARFNADGSGDWLELTIANPVLAAAFSSQAEVLTYARRASDLLGATPMDRPEWTTVAANGLVYCTLTNNTRRGTGSNPGPDAANPVGPNPDGHILRWWDHDDGVGTTFQWEIFVVCADLKDTEVTFASPDGLWADPDGRLFIETDGSQHQGLNDQLLVADIYTGEIRRLLEGVNGCEVTGITVTPDRRTMFVNLQHPDPKSKVPKDATIALFRKDGGIVGS